MISKLRASALAAVFVAYGCSSQQPSPPATGTPPPNDAGADSTIDTDASPGGGIHYDGGDPLGGPDGSSSDVVVWPSAACKAKTAGLLAQMSRKQKAAQMVMAPNPTADEITTLAPGAVFGPGGAAPPTGTDAAAWATMIDSYTAAAAKAPLGIPILYGIDAVHGFNAATGTVIFPHNAGLGSSRDPALVEELTRVTALESAAAGVTWTFAPTVSEAWDYRWGRVYESFSYDPKVTAELVQASVKGLQGAKGLGTGTPGIVACAKHFAGDGQASPPSAKGGVVDRGDLKIDDATMQAQGIDPYIPSLRSGLGCIMVSDATWNGKSLTSNGTLITDVLKTQLHFQGFVVTDWNAANTAGGIVQTINAGVDMLMQPDDWKGAINTIAGPGISDARVDDAVTRILNVKCEAGLFEYKRDKTLLASVGSAQHRAVARKAVSASLVLLQNDNKVLPLAKTTKVWVGGSGANSLDNQCGGWTLAWQGSGGKTTGTTIAQAVAKVRAPVATMADADVAIVVLSEPPYAEFLGDKQNIDTLPAADFALLDQAKAAGKKVVAIVVSGRPALIASHLQSADAWIAAWLPGTEGDGVADVVFGDTKPTGKLSHHWPRTNEQVTVPTSGYQPLFEMGFGLTY
jgi:beta-glucosidase